MVRSRVYRHDVRCPDCGSNWMRQTKGYTRSIAMLAYSLALVCWQQWEKSNIRIG